LQNHQHHNPFHSIVDFLKECTGFQLLEDSELLRVAQQLQLEYQAKGHWIFREDQSRLDKIWILLEGRAELRWENDELPSPAKIELEKGDVFGAVSMLLSEGVSRRSMLTLEDCFFYTLAKSDFFELCRRFTEFKKSFTSYLNPQELEKSQRQSQLREWQKQGSQGVSWDQALALDSADRQLFRLPESTLLAQAVPRMLELRKDHIVVDRKGADPGLITYGSLCRFMISEQFDLQKPLSELVKTGLVSCHEKTTTLEALSLMARHGIHHLPIVNSLGQITAILNTRDMPQLREHSCVSLFQRLRKTLNGDDLGFVKKDLALMTRSLHHDGLSAEPITRLIAQVNDTVAEKVIAEVLQTTTHPPHPFCFVVFGSEGRSEQTLLVDQDNGLIFDCPPEEETQTRETFLNIGQQICTRLNHLGYPHCKGGVMASNPNCCRSLREWKIRFSSWIENPDPASILNTHIYFDIRSIYGSSELLTELKTDFMERLKFRGDHYFNHSGQAFAHAPLPLGFFQQIVVESNSQGQHLLDLKKVMNLIVEYARLLALKSGLQETNTLERLVHLEIKGVLEKEHSQELQQAYQHLMHLRLQTQEKNLELHGEGTNFVQTKQWGALERRVMKACLLLIQDCQRRVLRQLR
jgi:CBS domain-containing protein